MRQARSCYDHLAGQLGVAVTDLATQCGWVLGAPESWELAEGALDSCGAALGIELRPNPRTTRPVVRRCVDWTEHRPHLAGRFGATLLDGLLRAGWLARVPGSRVLSVTELGSRRLSALGALPWSTSLSR